MNTFKTRGVVLREYDTGEADKRLILLCKEYGRITVYAKGARKTKSKFMAASQLCTYGDFVIADGGQFFSLTQAEVIENFYAIRGEYERLVYAQYLLEICEKTLPAQTACDDLLLLLLKSLQHLSQNKISPFQTARVFLLRFFLFNGLAPEMNMCCICGEEFESNTKNIIFCDEGIICTQCYKSTAADSYGTVKKSRVSLLLSAAAVSAIRHILSSDVRAAFLFRVNDSVLKEIEKAAQLCWRGHFDAKLETENFLQKFI